MSKHTPGPWEIQHESCECEPPCGCHNPYPYKIYAPSRMVKPYKSLPEEPAEIVNFIEVNEALPGDELEANARLISAAPDLLAAAQAVFAAWRDYIEDDSQMMPAQLLDTSLTCDLAAAIAKATEAP